MNCCLQGWWRRTWGSSQPAITATEVTCTVLINVQHYSTHWISLMHDIRKFQLNTASLYSAHIDINPRNFRDIGPLLGYISKRCIRADICVIVINTEYLHRATLEHTANIFTVKLKQYETQPIAKQLQIQGASSQKLLQHKCKFYSWTCPCSQTVITRQKHDYFHNTKLHAFSCFVWNTYFAIQIALPPAMAVAIFVQNANDIMCWNAQLIRLWCSVVKLCKAVFQESFFPCQIYACANILTSDTECACDVKCLIFALTSMFNMQKFFIIIQYNTIMGFIELYFRSVQER